MNKIFFKGFTLIEVIVSIFIIGLISSVLLACFTYAYNNNKKAQMKYDVTMELSNTLEEICAELDNYNGELLEEITIKSIIDKVKGNADIAVSVKENLRVKDLYLINISLSYDDGREIEMLCTQKYVR